MKYFGTAGARGIWKKTLTTGLVEKITNAVVFLRSPKKVIIGMDTRSSGQEIAKTMKKIFNENGVAVVELGFVPSASVAYLTKKVGADLGVMITASHNPHEHNGINFYGKDGEIISGAELEKLDAMIDPIDMWQDYLVSRFEKCFAGEILPSVAIDFGNGSGSDVALNVLGRLGFTVDVYNNKPNGNNINLDCGSQHPENLKLLKPVDVTFFFDGDADRLGVMDENGQIISPDVLLGLYATKLEIRHCVSTVMMNTGVEKYLQSKNIRVTRTPVGERFIIEKFKEMKKSSFIHSMGGESSSHFIFPDILLRGDSLTSALHVLWIMCDTGRKLSELVKDIPLWYSVLHNTEIDIPSGETSGEDYRIMIRKSGTEKLTRVFVEAETEERVTKLLEHILKNGHM